MIKTLVLALILCFQAAFSQSFVRWFATTGNVSLSGAGTAATVQLQSSGNPRVTFESIVVYCSVACNVTLSANGTAATTTAGTVTPLLPASLGLVAPINFFTSSNVGSGTQQGGVINVPAGVPYVVCLNTACGMPANTSLSGGVGTGINYTATIASMTGTASLTFFMETM